MMHYELDVQQSLFGAQSLAALAAPVTSRINLKSNKRKN